MTIENHALTSIRIVSGLERLIKYNHMCRLYSCRWSKC